MPLLVKNVFHGGAFALGIFFAANGAGSLVASLATARRGIPSRPVTTIWTACAAATFGVRAALIAGGVIAAATRSVLFVPGVRDPDTRDKATAPAAGSC